MEPVPSTSSVGKRPAPPSTESSSKRVKQDSEKLPLYWICGDRKVTCQATYYGGLALIRFRRKSPDYDGNAMDRSVFVTKDELTTLKTELPRASRSWTIFQLIGTCQRITIWWHYSALRNRPGCATSKWVSSRNLWLPLWLLCLPMLLRDVDEAENLTPLDRLKEDGTDRLIREFEQSQWNAPVATVRPSIAPTPGPTPGWSGGHHRFEWCSDEDVFWRWFGYIITGVVDILGHGICYLTFYRPFWCFVNNSFY